MKKIKEIMVTSPQYCGTDENLQTVAQLMSRSNIGSVPVVDENKKAVGIITDRDVCLTAAARNKPLSEIKAKEIISRQNLHTCSTEDDLQTALKIMRTKQVGRLPVVDNEQKLKGIVSFNHIVRKTQGSGNEIEYKGEENVMKTLHSLASRATKPKSEMVL